MTSRLIDPPRAGGYGLDAQWSDDFHHAVHAFLTGERTSYYSDFGRADQIVKAINQSFVYDGIYSPFRNRRHGAPPGPHSGDRFVVAIQNHDQIGNRPRGDRLGTILEPSQRRSAAGLLLLAPSIPLIFMGEEYDETRPFPYFCSFEDRETAESARRGRRLEFAYEGNEDEVPDPQARNLRVGEAQLVLEGIAASWPPAAVPDPVESPPAPISPGPLARAPGLAAQNWHGQPGNPAAGAIDCGRELRSSHRGRRGKRGVAGRIFQSRRTRGAGAGRGAARRTIVARFRGSAVRRRSRGVLNHGCGWPRLCTPSM